MLLDGEDATDDVHTEAVDVAVSAVSSVPEVRAALLERQRALAAAGGIVVAGRDIGTVVLPDATLKVFLDASVDERADRRIAERGLDPDGRGGRPRPRAAPGARLPGPQPRRGTRCARPTTPSSSGPTATRSTQTVDLVIEAIERAEAATAAQAGAR